MSVPLSLALFVLDDIGLEAFEAYGRGGAGTYGYADTSEFTDWCAAGVKFTRSYGQQLCSPYRSSLLTARHPFRHGVLDIIRDDEDAPIAQGSLPQSEVTLAKILKKYGLRTACIGKWHMGNINQGGREHPNRMGFDWYVGNLFNIDQTDTSVVAGQTFNRGYYTWDATVQGRRRVSRVFHTTYCVNEAIRWVKDCGPRPFFCYLPLYGTHVPITNGSSFNAPPTALYDSATWTGAETNPTVTTAQLMHCHRAHTEATIRELQRFISTLDLETTMVIVTSDNGTDVNILANEVDPAYGPYTASHGKNTPYEPGICVPTVVFGAGVDNGGRTHTKLVSVVDIMPTVLDMMGLDAINPEELTIDGVSFADVLRDESDDGTREWSYSEWGQPIGAKPTSSDPDAGRTATEWAIIGGDELAGGTRGAGRYKLLRNSISGLYEFYDLAGSGIMEDANLTPSGDPDTDGLGEPLTSVFRAALEERTRLVCSGAEDAE